MTRSIKRLARGVAATRGKLMARADSGRSTRYPISSLKDTQISHEEGLAAFAQAP